MKKRKRQVILHHRLCLLATFCVLVVQKCNQNIPQRFKTLKLFKVYTAESLKKFLYRNFESLHDVVLLILQKIKFTMQLMKLLKVFIRDKHEIWCAYAKNTLKGDLTIFFF